MTASAILARLWRQYIWRYKADLLAMAPVLVLVAGTAASYAWILKFSTDTIATGNLSAIALVPIVVIGIVAVRAAGMWAQAIMTQGLSLKILRDLQIAMFAKLMSVDFARFQREDVGRLVSRFTNDITIVGYALVRAAQTSLRDSLTLIGSIAMMFYLDCVLAGGVIGVAPHFGGTRRVRREREPDRYRGRQQRLRGDHSCVDQSRHRLQHE